MTKELLGIENYGIKIFGTFLEYKKLRDKNLRN